MGPLEVAGLSDKGSGRKAERAGAGQGDFPAGVSVAAVQDDAVARFTRTP